MSGYVSDAALNDAAQNAVRGGVEIRLHNGDPGDHGQGHVIVLSNVVRIDTDGFTLAGGSRSRVGRCVTKQATHFGVLSATADHEIEAYSLWAGGTFKGSARFENAPISVARGHSFSVSAGAIGIQFSR